jgi:hypothetical protein
MSSMIFILQRSQITALAKQLGHRNRLKINRTYGSQNTFYLRFGPNSDVLDRCHENRRH